MHFASLVRSSPAVIGAFAGVPGWSRWWAVVLALHGKPRPDWGTPDERCAVMVRGFRFYGQLYLGLGLLLLGGAGLVARLGCDGYWLALAALAGADLVASSVLAFRGARLFGQGHARGRLLLTAFFVSVMLFLGAFVVAVSVAAHHHGALPCAANLSLLALLWLGGVGSYGIELAYLAGHQDLGTSQELPHCPGLT